MDLNEMKRYLWLVEQFRPNKGYFEFQGIFSSKKKAIAACKTRKFCITRAVLNQELPVKSIPRDYCWYPLAETELEGIKRK